MGERGSGGFLAFLFDEVRSAIQDVRQKAVEEGWFGRVTTPEPVVRADRTILGDRPSFEEQWAVREPTNGPALEQDGHDLGR